MSSSWVPFTRAQITGEQGNFQYHCAIVDVFGCRYANTKLPDHVPPRLDRYIFIGYRVGISGKSWVISDETIHGNKAAQCWAKVSRLNVNYELAHVGIGKSLLRQGMYKEAMKSFKLGGDRKYYSKAFKLYKEQLVEKHFGNAVLTLLIIIFVLTIKKRFRLRKGRFLLWK